MGHTDTGIENMRLFILQTATVRFFERTFLKLEFRFTRQLVLIDEKSSHVHLQRRCMMQYIEMRQDAPSNIVHLNNWWANHDLILRPVKIHTSIIRQGQHQHKEPMPTLLNYHKRWHSNKRGNYKPSYLWQMRLPEFNYMHLLFMIRSRLWGTEAAHTSMLLV